jgi:hypothetical protein
VRITAATVNAARAATQSKRVVCPSPRLAVNHAVDSRYNVRTPPKTLFVWCFINARYTAAAATVSIDERNTFPSGICRKEPLPKDIAAAPDSIPGMPPVI